jgi:hypothetical protein
MARLASLDKRSEPSLSADLLKNPDLLRKAKSIPEDDPFASDDEEVRPGPGAAVLRVLLVRRSVPRYPVPCTFCFGPPLTILPTFTPLTSTAGWERLGVSKG